MNEIRSLTARNFKFWEKNQHEYNMSRVSSLVNEMKMGFDCLTICLLCFFCPLIAGLYALNYYYRD